MVVARMLDAMPALRIGDPRDDRIQIGPVVPDAPLAGNLDCVRLAAEEGCQAMGGERLDRPGYFQNPALFIGADDPMRSSRQEIFGPCALVIRVADFDEALSVASDTPFGLSSGIRTRSLKQATAFRRSSKAGIMMVNLPMAGVDDHVPLGGCGASSLGGREQGRIAMDFYTSIKTACDLPCGRDPKLHLPMRRAVPGIARRFSCKPCRSAGAGPIPGQENIACQRQFGILPGAGCCQSCL